MVRNLVVVIKEFPGVGVQAHHYYPTMVRMAKYQEYKVALMDTLREMVFKRHTFQHEYTYEGYYYKTTFPMVLAYAMTWHNCQDAITRTNAMVDI